MRFRAILLASALLIVSTVAAQTERPRIGVVNLEADPALAALARQATVALTAALVNSRMFEVLDQSSMLQEFTVGIARTHADRDRLVQTLRGEACTETQCLAEMGDALEARFMVAGHLTRSGRTTTVSVRLVDVFSTSILSYPRQSFDGDAGAGLDAAMNASASDLIHALPGEVRLYGLPADAAVLVDGRLVTWRDDRPLPLPPGRHEIRAIRPGFDAAATTVDIEYGAAAERRIAMARRSALAATARSLVFPGLGHYYGARRTRGTLFLVAELAAIGGIGYTVYANMNANSEYDDAKASYVGLVGPGVTQTDIDVARAKMTDAWDRTNSTNRLNLIALGILAGLHALNVIDAGLGFPDLDEVRIVEKPGGATLIDIRIDLAGRDRR